MNSVYSKFNPAAGSKTADMRHRAFIESNAFGGFVYIRNKKCVSHRNPWMDGAESRRWHGRHTRSLSYIHKEAKCACRENTL